MAEVRAKYRRPQATRKTISAKWSRSQYLEAQFLNSFDNTIRTITGRNLTSTVAFTGSIIEVMPCRADEPAQ